jgi:mannosylglycoprotein endo-beta-mannosidase
VFLKREKLHLSAIIDELEDLTEVRLLSSDEIESKSQSNAQITTLLCAEELKWYQCSKAQLISEGDSNTRYFHGIANGRYRKKHIQSLL